MDAEQDEIDPRLAMRLGDELRNTLDRQVGRAAPYFLNRCSAQREVVPMRRRRTMRLLAGLAAIAAAACATFVAWEQTGSWKRPDEPLRKVVAAGPPAAAEKRAAAEKPTAEGADATGTAPESAGEVVGAAAAGPLILGRTLKTRTLDEGTLLVGRTAVRKVRRQWLERVEWFDSRNGARVQRIVPHEEIVFVPLPIN
ncbi:MAG TPA: hypothetical protein VG125_25625 [Pirellulales bacterium]|jgi:hypothetical protein|nr:hypothetical protein [Pirellulales bacterium]